MFVETHILQNFAPSNLNRDDTGAPKECMFGGYRRARISSQCLKRAMRSRFADSVGGGELALRIKYLASQLAERLQGRGRAAEDASRVARAAVASSGIPSDNKSGLTSYLLFLDPSELDGLANVSERHWDELLASAVETTTPKATACSARRRPGSRSAVSCETYSLPGGGNAARSTWRSLGG